MARHRIAKNRGQDQTGALRRALGVTPFDELSLPDADGLAGQRNQSVVAEFWEDMCLDHVSVIAQSCQFQILRREPFIDPLDESDRSCPGVDVGIVSDGGFLVASVVLGVLARRESGLGVQGAVRCSPPGAPQVSPLLCICHVCGLPIRPRGAGRCVAGHVAVPRSGSAVSALDALVSVRSPSYPDRTEPPR